MNIAEMLKDINKEINQKSLPKITSKNIMDDKHYGTTITDIEGMEEGSTEILIFLKGSRTPRTCITLYHEQDCCENVVVDQVDGSVYRHIGATIFAIREKVSYEEEGEDLEICDDSNTWTFYDIETSKGRLSFRWHGSSNGYYSESVNIKQ